MLRAALKNIISGQVKARCPQCVFFGMCSEAPITLMLHVHFFELWRVNSLLRVPTLPSSTPRRELGDSMNQVSPESGHLLITGPRCHLETIQAPHFHGHCASSPQVPTGLLQLLAYGKARGQTVFAAMCMF